MFIVGLCRIKNLLFKFSYSESKGCMFCVMTLFKLEIHDEFDSSLFTVNLFGFVFRKDRHNEFSIWITLDYLKVRNIEITWIVGTNIKTSGIVEKYEIKHITILKKVIFYIGDYFFFCDSVPNLKLSVIDNSEFLKQLDLHPSRILCCRIGIIRIFFCELLNYDDEALRLRFVFIVLLDNEIVRTCGLYIHNSIAGFYSDGALPLYSVCGIGSQMILGKIKIARKFECNYIVVYCMRLFINLYKRLGFSVLVNPHLCNFSSQFLR